jgi:hypothetical protein
VKKLRAGKPTASPATIAGAFYGEKTVKKPYCINRWHFSGCKGTKYYLNKYKIQSIFMVFFWFFALLFVPLHHHSLIYI